MRKHWLTDLTWMDKVSKRSSLGILGDLFCVYGFHGDSSVDGDVMDMSLAMMGGFFPGGQLTQAKPTQRERAM